MKVKSEGEVAQPCPTLSDPMDCMHPIRFLHPWDFPGKSTGVGCHCLLHLLGIYLLIKVELLDHMVCLCLNFGSCMQSHFSRVWLSVTLWTVACQALLSMGFSRQEYWRGLPCCHTFPKELQHFTFLPAVHECFNLFAFSPTLVYIFYYSHPSRCKFLAYCGFNLHFLDD